MHPSQYLVWWCQLSAALFALMLSIITSTVFEHSCTNDLVLLIYIFFSFRCQTTERAENSDLN